MNNQNNLLKNPWLQPGTCVAILLAFLLPFSTIKCGGIKMASVQGIDMVMGGKPEVASSMGRLPGEGMENLEGVNKKVKTNIWVIMALGAAVAAGGLHFAQFQQKPALLLGFAAMGLVALLVFAITKNSFFELDKISNAGNRSGRGNFDLNMDRAISIGLGIGYWLGVAGFALLAWLGWSGMQQKPAAEAAAPGAQKPEA